MSARATWVCSPQEDGRVLVRAWESVGDLVLSREEARTLAAGLLAHLCSAPPVVRTKPMEPLQAFAEHAATSCVDVCGRSFAYGDCEPCPVGDCLLSCMSQDRKAAEWVEAECRRFAEAPSTTLDEAEAVDVLGGVIASGLLAGEHLKGAP